MDQIQPIDQVVSVLPPDIRDEVRDFILFLMEKRAQKSGRKLRQDWAGALREHREEYTSLELQKKAQEWRGD